jgi:hypothetical protein
MAVSQINAAQRATGKNMNELFSQMSAESFKMDELMEGLVGKIANRKLGIQAYEKGQANVTAAQNKQNGMQNLMGVIAQNGGSDWLKKLLSPSAATGISGVTEGAAESEPAMTAMMDGGIGGLAAFA